MSGDNPKSNPFTRESVPSEGSATTDARYPQEVISQVSQCITEGIGKLAPLREQWTDAQGVNMQNQWAYLSALAVLEACHLAMQNIISHNFKLDVGEGVATPVSAGGYTPRRT